MPVINSGLFQWVVLPLFIFTARVLDVSLDTMRIMLFSRGKKNIAPFLGFVQVMIWLLAIRQVFLNSSNVACYVAYAGGFAAGTWVGVLLEEKLAIGVQVIRVITRSDAITLISFLKEKGFGVTSVEGQGVTGKVNIIYTVVKREDIFKAIGIIKRFNPKAFYTIEDIRTVSEAASFIKKRSLLNRLTHFRN